MELPGSQEPNQNMEPEDRYTFEGKPEEPFGVYRGYWVYTIFRNGNVFSRFRTRGKQTEKQIEQRIEDLFEPSQ